MRSTFLPFCLPSIGPEELAVASAALSSQWLSTGPEAARFEEEFAPYVGAPAALGLNSGTAALHLGLLALGVGPGDRVITTPMTFCSTLHVIEHVGAEPVLVDVEPDTLNLDPAAVVRALDAPGGDRVKVLLPVHLYGHPCEMAPLVDLAERRGLGILEDAAHALPAAYRGRRIGSGWGGGVRWLVAFSFYATKNLTTGEGGMLVGPRDLVEQARGLSLHGMNRDAYRRYRADGTWQYDVDAAGFKYNLTDVAAAIGRVQLRRLPAFQARRAEIVRSYHAAFASDPRLVVPTVRADVDSAWHLYVLRLRAGAFAETTPGDARARFIDELKARNIGTSVHFIPVHLFAHQRRKYGHEPTDFPVAYDEYLRLVSLPLYPGLSDPDVTDVVEAVRAALDAIQPGPGRPAASPEPDPVPVLPDIPGKRAFDVTVALAVLIVGAPLWAVVALAIWLESGRPIVYRAPRVGLGGRLFTMFKFRSMVRDAATRGPAVTLPDDPRLTRVGRVLRTMKLDEMPQLVNILRGELSVVGPRPEDPAYAARYTTEQRRVLAIRPGLTNPAMIKYRHEQDLLAAAPGDPEQTYLEVHLPDRLEMDLEYLKRRSFGYDLRILLQAFLSLFRRRDLPRDHPLPAKSSRAVTAGPSHDA